MPSHNHNHQQSVSITACPQANDPTVACSISTLDDALTQQVSRVYLSQPIGWLGFPQKFGEQLTFVCFFPMHFTTTWNWSGFSRPGNQWHEVTPVVSCGGWEHFLPCWHFLAHLALSKDVMLQTWFTYSDIAWTCVIQDLSTYEVWWTIPHVSYHGPEPNPFSDKAELQNNTWAGDDLLLNVSTVDPYKDCLYIVMIL